MYDAAYPPGHPPAWPVVAGYLGGNTPHVWSATEWAHQPARYRLPIWVRSQPGSVDPARDAAAAVSAAAKLGVPHGATIALDFETAVNGSYVKAFDKVLQAAGHGVILYGSADTVRSNPTPSRGYWEARWTGTPHQETGAYATQYSNGQAYDSSVIDLAKVPLWDSHPPAPPAGTSAAATGPAATLEHQVWMTDGVFPVPAEWNGAAGNTNPYWTPANVLTYGITLLRDIRSRIEAIEEKSK
jgi:hypothetical protein